MRFATIVGARPQFIKLAPVSRALRQWHEELIIHTGQHYDENMSATFFEEMDIPAPHYNLGIGSGPHGMQTGRMLEAIEAVLMQERPEGVIVFGDTNSTVAGALAAAKLHMPVAHVEAGVRSFDRSMPEEINRVVTDHLSTWLFCPTEAARRYASDEGLTRGVELVGDVMYDLLLQLQPRLIQRAETLLPELGVEPGGYVVATIHRPFHTDEPEVLGGIAQALGDLDMPVIFPVHPRTRNLMEQYHIEWGKPVRLMEPVGHLDMLTLQRSAYRIVTDSGGIQKEAFLLGVPCVTLRHSTIQTTEWPETLQGGWNVVVEGAQPSAIVEAVHRPTPEPLTLAHDNPFGNGDAAARIAQSLSALP
jgi:UDP-N-acetylglucosamine 2-epimerase (non-hydrolysing)